MTTIQVSKPRNQKRGGGGGGWRIHDEPMDVCVSMNVSMVRTIDSIRGDTNRSLWLRRAVLRELERLKITIEKEEQQQRSS